MTSIKWNEAHSVHVGVIDKQHQHFVDLLNKLYKSLESGDTKKISGIINDLASYTGHHFKTEEEYFDKFHYEDSELHKDAHRELSTKMKSFIDRKDDPKAIGFDLLYFLERWFLFHLKGMDRKYTKCFNQHGLK